MKKQILSLSFILFSFFLSAQDSDSSKCKNWDLSFGTDIASRYLWRGQQLSNSPCLQPAATLSYKNISLTSWSSYTFSKENLQEFDLYLAYQIKNVTIAVNDYFVPDESLANNKYFELRKEKTSHVVEASLSWTGEKIPVSLTAGTFIYGADNSYGYDNKKDSLGDNYYSTYAEIAYNTSIKDNDLSIFLGLTPQYGYYGNTAGVINCGVNISKEIPITDKFSLPLSSTIMFNPQTQNCWVGLFISL